MRNLKKFLALVLAMMMAFSLMVTANATTTGTQYGDADGVTEAFEEAVDVLTGMGVYSGDNGNFKPAANITRAEVAALIYRLATGDVTDAQAHLYAEYGNFTDVPHDAWYAGYVGYCANAGYIKGRPNGNFDPSGNVTGYEALAMILRAIGYDKNGEFTGSTWQTEVSALSQQLGILTNVKTTQYGGTLYLAARRDVVADLLFQADAYVPMVVYTPAFGYQPYGMVNGNSGSLIGTTTTPNPTLGKRIFGLSLSKEGVLLGNQQTGESKSVMGYASNSKEFDAKPATTHVDGSPITTWPSGVPYSAYTWQGRYDVSTLGTIAKASATGTAATDDAKNAVVGKNVTFTMETGIDLIGHNLKLWYDDGTGSASKSGRPVFAYFDEVEHTAIVTVSDGSTAQGNPTAVNATSDQYANGGRNLYDLIEGAGFKAPNANTTAVFNNSFGLFGTDFATAATDGVGNGEDVDEADAIASPVRLYKLISNSGNKQLDAVIALNIESSQITESNNVNRVPTLGMPVMDNGTVDLTDGSQFETMFITAGTGGGLDADGIGAGSPTTAAGVNVKSVNSVLTGVIAQAALVGNSAKNLGDYEMGIHITGTSPRTVSSAETTAINGTGAETAYFLLNKVEAPVQGTVVAYNVAKGTVTLDNGTVLERSKYYHTVVGWSDAQPKGDPAPNTAIPQGWVQGATNWEEGYANVAYKFYMDHEGKYLGAERTFGSEFLYGTYLDYSQATSSSTFNYYLTGVDMNGEIKTVQLKQFWAPGMTTPPGTMDEWGQASTTTLTNITGTNQLGVPFRDTANNTAGSINGIGEGVYRGFAITGDIADGIANDPYANRNEYLNNMARMGIHNGAYQSDRAGTAETAFNADIQITNTDVTLGAKQTTASSNKYFTEATKFILVSGYGTDSVKAEVFTGISELKGSASQVVLNMDGAVGTDVSIGHIANATVVNAMTYFTESPYTYAQSGATAMKIDTIVLPKAAVSWSGGSGLYYVGDPNYTSINSWGIDAWKYNLYRDGELEQIWLTNDPSNGTAPAAYNTVGAKDHTYNLVNDVFLNLKDTGEKANDGQPIYTAGQYDNNGMWHPGVYFDNENGYGLQGTTGATTAAVYNATSNRPQLGYMAQVSYSATTRDAQTAIFGGSDGTIGSPMDATDILERVAGAKVVNLNHEDNCVRRPSSGYIWPGITDLATLNQAGSIDPVTGRPLKVSAVVDPSNPLIVTCIYVCYEQ